MSLSFDNLKAEIAEILDISKDDLRRDTALMGSEHWDSFAILSAVALANQYTKKDVSLGDLSKLPTVNDLVLLLQGLKG